MQGLNYNHQRVYGKPTYGNGYGQGYGRGNGYGNVKGIGYGKSFAKPYRGWLHNKPKDPIVSQYNG